MDGTSPFAPDPAQRSVLEHDRGALLVRGGPGTGKTAVLRERFARLIEAGCDPERVALVVRSKRDRVRARAALLDRLRTPMPSLGVFTVHALAFRVLERYHRRLGYVEPPRVLSAADQFARVRGLLADEAPSAWPTYGALLGLHGFADQIRQLVLRAQERLVPPERVLELAEAPGQERWRELGRFYDRYLRALAAAGEVDFAGLVARAADAVAPQDAPFEHVLVDDYQEATPSLERLLERLGPVSLVVAGDPESHVFGFQGTTAEPLLRFPERFGAAVVELATPHRGPSPSVEGWRAPHPSEEHAAIARELRRIHVEEGVPWRDLAVVTRRQDAQAAALVRALEDAGIPHTEPEGSPTPAAAPATAPYVLALRWLVATDEERNDLVVPLLTSRLAGLSPATARTLVRSALASGRPPRDALGIDEGLGEAERAAVARLREVLDRAAGRAASVLDAFAVCWRELPCSAELVAAAEHDPVARADLEEVVALARAIELAGSSEDPSIPTFLEALAAREGAPELAAPSETEPDAVAVLTAHGAAGLEFDTVIVAGAVEGNFPSLARPEPLFDLEAPGRPRPRAELNRERLAEERRLFRLVLSRARRRVILTTSASEDADAVTTVSRFADELDLPWRDAPIPPFPDPVSVVEARATWRRTLADRSAPPAERLACLEGLLALGVDPGRWWFQLDWSSTGPPERDALRLSYSRLSHLENCELQYLLADELGLDPGGGYPAWVGHLVHRIIQEIEAGRIPRTRQAFAAEIERRWDPSRFPSHAVSEAERRHALETFVPNWFERYGDLPARATERRFAFEFDGATISGVIDRIGPVPEGELRITDFKTGRPENAGPVAQNLQLGMYFLAVRECPDLAAYRDELAGVELAFLGGKRNDPSMKVQAWPLSGGREEGYERRMRERLAALIARVRELDEAGAYVASTSADCMFCRFRTLCPRYPEGGPVFPITGGAPAEASAR
ncbi:MAG: DNA helicase [Actinomycetota bacterium]|nr:MAG: DNA helicase [Actinomycetota bacterium]